MTVQMQNPDATTFVEVIKRLACPDCGAKMAEVERVTEKGYFYIWYECTQQNCPGQWLEKKLMHQTWEWRNK
jgi:hypothetical protein